MNKPAVSYPCRWSFTLIGTDAKAIQEAVAACLKPRRYDLAPSNKSRTGKFVSLNLDTEVVSEDERNRLFAQLQAAPSIKMVL